LIKECFRCTAWAMSVEPDVVPPALESGHVSIEEIRGDAPDESGFGAEIRQLNRGIVESDLQDLDGECFVSSAMSVSDVPSSTLPPHLRAPANSIASSVSGSVSGSRAPSTSRAPSSTVFPLRAPSSRAPRAPSVVSYGSRQLPPHLGGRAESVSTATTIRDARAQESAPFNAWDINGNRYNALRPPTTTDGMTSQSGRTGSVISGSTGTDTNVSSFDSRFSRMNVITDACRSFQRRTV
jgi:hypothetical protein